MEGLIDIKLCEDMGLAYAGEGLLDQRKGVLVLIGKCIKLVVINIEP